VAIAGATSALLKSLLMPFLLRRFPILRVYAACMATWPLTFLLFPLLNILARNEPSTKVLWAGVSLVAVMSRIGTLSFTYVCVHRLHLHVPCSRVMCRTSMILVRETAPGAASLGASNALAEVSQSLAIALSPVFVSWLFSLSVESRALGGHAWALAMAMLSITGIWLVQRIGKVRRGHAYGYVD
jgi:hypothetical protein